MTGDPSSGVNQDSKQARVESSTARPQERIVVVDFGGQYAHLIATKVRRMKVYAEIVQPEDPLEVYEGVSGVILSGSPALSSLGEDSDYNAGIQDLDVPILGFCFGHQELAKRYGGTIVHGGREWGKVSLHLCREHPLFEGVPDASTVFMSHFDSVVALGPDFEELGYSVSGPEGEEHRFAAIGSDRLRRYGFQYHPEVDDTIFGEQMISNFLFKICGCQGQWTMARYVDQQLEALRARIGDDSVFLLASGGVDSTVAAKLIAAAVGPERMHLLHVDNGLMRKGESRKVLEMFEDLGLATNLHFIDASDEFLAALKGLVEPERKRLAIGDTFIEVFEREAGRYGIADHLLGQGTIYPDTIETGGTKRADTIKTHHNRVQVIEDMIAAGRVVEPLSELYKVEVRELGERLGIEHSALWRHPFPGPGLGVRLLCSDGVDDGKAKALTPRVAALAAEKGLQALVLPIRSVGVKADLRSYEHPVLLCGDADWETFLELSSRLLADVDGINRCVWRLGAGLPRSVSLCAATTTRERLDVLRDADALVMEGLVRHGIYDRIWQCPTAMAPLSFDDGIPGVDPASRNEVVILRPVHSARAMTATPAPLPEALRHELAASIGALPGVSGLVFDLSSKPPGTIEWE